MLQQKNTKKTFKSPFNNPLKCREVNEKTKTSNPKKEKLYSEQQECSYIYAPVSRVLNTAARDKKKETSFKRSVSLIRKPAAKQEKSKNEHHKKQPSISKKTVKNEERNHIKNEKKTEAKKLPMTSLTDVQYEEIFSSAISRAMTGGLPSPNDSSNEEQIEDRAAIPKPNEAYSPPESAEEQQEFSTDVKQDTAKKPSTSKHKSVKGNTTDRLNCLYNQEITEHDKASNLKQTKKATKSFVPLNKNEESTKNSRPGDKQLKGKVTTEIINSSFNKSSQDSHSDTHVCRKHHTHTCRHKVSSQSSCHSQQLSLSQSSQQLPFSQPDPKLSLKERLLWLQNRRQIGLWVQCSRPICNKWRYLKNVHDPVEIPHEWFCHMNPDERYNSCAAPEKPPTPLEEEDLIHNLYTAGSIVWGRLDGYPWWPAMVDDCPDTEQYYWLNSFSDIPTHYNVVFFDEKDVTRAWLTPGKMRPFTGTETSKEFRKTTANGVDYATRLEAARIQALKALPLRISERLKTFSFLARFKGPFGTLNKKKSIHANKRKHDTDESEDEIEEMGYGKSAAETNVTTGKQNKKKKLISNIFTKKSQKNSKENEEELNQIANEDETLDGRNSNMNYNDIGNTEQLGCPKEKVQNKFNFNNSSLYTQELTNKEKDKPKQKTFGLKNLSKVNENVSKQNTTPEKSSLKEQMQEELEKTPLVEMKWREQNKKRKYLDISSSDDDNQSVCSVASLWMEDRSSSQDLFMSDEENTCRQNKPILEKNCRSSTGYVKLPNSHDTKDRNTQKDYFESTKTITNNITTTVNDNKVSTLFHSEKEKIEEIDSEQTKATTDDSTRVIIGGNKSSAKFDTQKKKAEENDSQQTKATTDDSTRVIIGSNKASAKFDTPKKKAEEIDSQQTKATTDDSTRVIIGNNKASAKFDTPKKKAEENDSQQTKATTDDSTRVIIGCNKSLATCTSQNKNAEENGHKRSKATADDNDRYKKTTSLEHHMNNAEEDKISTTTDQMKIPEGRENLQNESCSVHDEQIDSNEPDSSTPPEITNEALNELVNENNNQVLETPPVLQREVTNEMLSASENSNKDSAEILNVSDNANGNTEDGQIFPSSSTENARAYLQIRELSSSSSVAIVPNSQRNTPQLERIQTEHNSDGVVPQLNPDNSLYDSDDFEPEE